MLFGETVAVYCENHTEHTDTVSTSQETHYVSTTEPNRLMLFIVRAVHKQSLEQWTLFSELIKICRLDTEAVSLRVGFAIRGTGTRVARDFEELNRACAL
jgi:hypothetical protein